MKQVERHGIEEFAKLVDEQGIKKFMIVCDQSFRSLNIREAVDEVSVPHVIFSDFTTNPLHEDAAKGICVLKNEGCEAIVAVGGGSSMDVAKCIKLDSGFDLPLIAIPTTAGTGSESTKHIVVYKDGEKESLGNENTIPNYVIFEPKVLKSLPVYQKKSTMLDALCQAIESWWNVNRTDESIEYSKEAIALIMKHKDAYIHDNDEEAAKQIMKAANLAGKAINITATTAPHAMSYKITSMYRMPHGHAVAICFPEVWDEMLKDSQSDALSCLFKHIANTLGADTPKEAIESFRKMLAYYEMEYPQSEHKEEDVEVLTKSVNPVRLKNNPIQFDEETIKRMYQRIVKP